jgi:arylformamidase
MAMIFLSHALSTETPAFGAGASFLREKTRSMARGDSSNSESWQFNNHLGTHIDLPKHFDDNGRSMSDYQAADFVFSKVTLIDAPAKKSELIDSPEIRDQISPDCDLILVRTSFEKLRNTSDYWEQNPGLSIEFCQWIRKERPRVRAIGFDFISLTAFQHREAGRKAHQILLGDSGLIIIEDMKLQSLKKSPSRVIVAPLRVENADGAPATVIAEVA